MPTTQTPKKAAMVEPQPRSAMPREQRPASPEVGPEQALAMVGRERGTLGASGVLALQNAAGNSAVVGLVQRKARASKTREGAALPSIARAGMSGIAGELPHRETIERSFGSHDVRGIRAFVGGPATAASRALGARAYATGDATVFSAAPDLHTAAHEAAHVVQQRAGVQLRGGVGEVGDRHEQHADAVADRVVQGRSAEGLLDQYGGGGATRGLQLLGDGDTEKLGEYIDAKIDALDLVVMPAARTAKRDEIAAKHDGKKGLQNAKAEVDVWIAELKRAQDERHTNLLAAHAAKAKASAEPEHKEKPEAKASATTSATTATSSAKSRKKASFKPLDLSTVSTAPKGPLTGFASVTAAAIAKPPPLATPKAPASGAPAVIAKIKSWSPGSGHGGCNGMALSTAELQEIVDWAESQPTKYFVKKGAGTGSYSAKNQLKIIHKVVMAGSKHATYHITAKQSELDGLSIGEEDA